MNYACRPNLPPLYYHRITHPIWRRHRRIYVTVYAAIYGPVSYVCTVTAPRGLSSTKMID